jgi:hypothetical protein
MRKLHGNHTSSRKGLTIFIPQTIAKAEEIIMDKSHAKKLMCVVLTGGGGNM